MNLQLRGNPEAWAILLILGMTFGFGKTFPWSLLRSPTDHLLWLTLTFTWAACFFSSRASNRVLSAWNSATQGGVWLRMLLVVDLAFFFLLWSKFKAMGYSFPWLHLLIAGFGLFFIRVERLKISALLSLGFLAASISHFPLHPDRSDMLISIRETLDGWNHHQGIYQAVPVGGWKALAHYLPGTLFSHLPAWALGIDLRWNQFIYRCLWMGLFFWKAREHRLTSNSSKLLHLLLLNPYWNYRHELYFEFFLLVIVAFWTLPRWRVLSFPLAVWTRQWVWTLAPFVWIEAYRNRKNPREYVGYWVGLTLVSAVFLAFLVSREDQTRFFEAHHFLNSFNEKSAYIGDYGLTFAPLLFWFESAKAIPTLQAGICGLGLLAAVLGPANAVMQTGVVVTALTIALNGLYWNYFLISLTFWLVMGVVLSDHFLPVGKRESIDRGY